MIFFLLFFLSLNINPNLSDYYSNINSIQKLDNHSSHTKTNLFELSHNLYKELSSTPDLINLQSMPRIFNTQTNILQFLTSSQTVIKVITLLTAQVLNSFSVLEQYLFTSVDIQHSWLVPDLRPVELCERE